MCVLTPKELRNVALGTARIPVPGVRPAAEGSKNTPLITAFAPAFSIIWNWTCPCTVQTRYSPLWKLPVGRTWLLRTTPVTASSTLMVSERAEERDLMRVAIGQVHIDCETAPHKPSSGNAV